MEGPKAAFKKRMSSNRSQESGNSLIVVWPQLGGMSSKSRSYSQDEAFSCRSTKEQRSEQILHVGQ